MVLLYTDCLTGDLCFIIGFILPAEWESNIKWTSDKKLNAVQNFERSYLRKYAVILLKFAAHMSITNYDSDIKTQ